MRPVPVPAVLSVATALSLAMALPAGAQVTKTPPAKTPPAKAPAAQLPAGVQRPGGIQGSELVIVVTDKGFEAPAQVDAGLVNVRLFNRSAGPQHFTILKVDRLDRLPQIANYLRSGDWNVPWINRMGGPEWTPTGSVSSVSMVLEPGRYVVAQLPVNRVPGGPLFLGEVSELAVIKRADGTAGVVRLPPAEVTLDLYEWNFTMRGPLLAGRRTIRVENKGQFEHQVSIVRLLPGSGFDQAVKWSENPSGPPPFEGVGGTTNLARGRAVNVTVDLMPGDYALLCTTFNPLSKRLHSQHGMIQQFRVTP